MNDQKAYSSERGSINTRLLTGAVVLLTMVFLGAWGLALFQSNSLKAGSINQEFSAVPSATGSEPSCQNIIDQAIQASGNYCDHIGPNQVCYGHTTIKADLIPDAENSFAKTGDVIDLQFLRRLSTAPLNLQKNEWGIAILNIIANLPRSLPGESAKMVVFGNTTLANNRNEEIQSFYFSSELGQIVCEKVPFDGILITMPDGTGVRLIINDADLTLMGNAGLTSVKNGNMEISLFSGEASVTSAGKTQVFLAGQKIQIPMGGASVTEAVGPPALPISLSPIDSSLICTMTGMACSTTAIATGTIPPTQATSTAFTTGTALPIQTAQPTLTVLPTGTPINNIAAPTANPQPTQKIYTPEPAQPKDPKVPKEKKTPPGQEKKTPKPGKS